MSYSYQFPENLSTPTTPHDAFPQWETVEREQHQHQHQHQLLEQSDQQPQHQQQQQPYPQIIQLEDPPHLVPTQNPEPHIKRRRNRSHEDRSDIQSPGNARPLLLRVDTTRPSTSPVASGSTMPLRPTRAHHQPPHPYTRPPNATTKSRDPRNREAQVRFTPTSAAPSPAARIASFGSTVSSPVINTDAPAFTRHDGVYPPIRKFSIRTDSYLDLETKVFVAMLELPGVKKGDVNVTLSRCIYNGVRQITVNGFTRSPFPPPPQEGLGLPTVRERKFGEYVRTFPVPADIKREDIDVTMEDGILIIRMPFGSLTEPDAQNVPVR